MQEQPKIELQHLVLGHVGAAIADALPPMTGRFRHT